MKMNLILSLWDLKLFVVKKKLLKINFHEYLLTYRRTNISF